MEWNRSETLALSSAKCKHCRGTGLHVKAGVPDEPCNCVLRGIFRACFKRFIECASMVSAELSVTQEGGGGWGRKNEEYVADFELIMRRTLTPEEQKLFRYHCLLGADARLCCRKFGIEKGSFFHTLYRIQHKLGQAFRETEPYPLYPVDEYFVTVIRDRTAPKVIEMPKPKQELSPRVPLKRAA
jgi:hypothetical protein